jgi:hypothetical protein
MKKIFIILTLNCLINFSFGQDEINSPVVISPSPTAAALGKYGEHPVSMSKGTPTISIPFWEINEGALSVPISLSYHASGIKVSEIASWVGLGWSLNAGGVITRTVRGLPDDNQFGFRREGKNIPEEIVEDAFPPLPDDFDFLDKAEKGLKDYEPDMFSYNFGGFSGQFVFGNDGEVCLLPNNNIKVQVLGNIMSFVITTDDGAIYIFSEKERTSSSNHYSGISYTSSWYLSEIIAPNQIDHIFFIYKNNRIEYDIHISSSHTYSREKIIGGPPYTDWVLTVNPINHTHLIVEHAKKIDQIVTKDTRIQFSSSADRLDLVGETKLNEIKVSSHSTPFTENSLKLLSQNPEWDTQVAVKIYSFNYDYFISDLIYPSDPSISNRLKLLDITEADKKHSFDYNNVKLPPRNSKSIDHWGFYNNEPNTTFVPETFFDNKPREGANKEANGDYSGACMLKRITYPTGGYSEFDFEGHEVKLDQNDLKRKSHPISLIHYGKQHNEIPPLNIDPMDAFFLENEPDLPEDLFRYYKEFSPINFYCCGKLILEMIDSEQGSIYEPRFGYVCIRDLTTGANIFTIRMQVNTHIEYDIILNPEHQYAIFAQAYHSPTYHITADLEWLENTDIGSLNKYQVGGQRIKEIRSWDGTTNKVMTYGYNTFIDNQISSGQISLSPEYYYTTIEEYCDPNNVSCLIYKTIEKRIVQSNSVTQLGSVSYGEVTEYFGPPSNNLGKIENTYSLAKDDGGHCFPYAAPTSNEWQRGQLLHSIIYENDNGTYNPKKEIINDYTQIYNSTVRGLKVGRLRTVVLCPNTGHDFGTFKWSNIYIQSYKKVISKRTEKEYNDNQEIITKVTNYKYNNPLHNYVSEMSTNLSDGSTYITRYKYPNDYIVGKECFEDYVSSIAPIQNEIALCDFTLSRCKLVSCQLDIVA